MPESEPGRSGRPATRRATASLDTSGLRRPVSPASVLAPAGSARYTEIGGVAAVCHVGSRQVSLLSPAAAARWAGFDGATPLGAIGTDRATVELARRLRALGVLVDAEAGSPTGSAAVDLGDAVPVEELALHGTVAPSTDARGPVVGLRRAPVIGGDHAAPVPPVVRVRLDPTGPSIDGAAIDHLRAPDDDGPPATSDGTAPLALLEAFEVLVACTTVEDLSRPGGIDAVAELAERVPVRVVGRDAPAGHPTSG